jgi:hypothetical protein
MLGVRLTDRDPDSDIDMALLAAERLQTRAVIRPGHVCRPWAAP